MNCYPADDIDNNSEPTSDISSSLFIVAVTYAVEILSISVTKGHKYRSLRNKMINISIQLNLFETKNRHFAVSFSFHDFSFFRRMCLCVSIGLVFRNVI